MAKYITVKRRHLVYVGLVVCIACLGVLGLNILFGDSETSTVPTKVEPELKILSLDFDPPIAVKDVTYDGETFKGLHAINKSNFMLSAVVQNMTEKTMTDVPVKLTITSLADKTKTTSKEGSIATLEPGATAKITFENISAHGDAKGKSATAGQHELVLAMNRNVDGGLSQSTEARFIFNVDSALK